MKEVRVLQVLDNFYPSFDGPTMLVTNYTKSLNKKFGIYASVMAPYFPKYKDSQPFEITRIKSIKMPEGMRGSTPWLDKNFLKFFKENQVDIIHVHSPFTLGRAAIKMGKKLNIPTVLTIHTKYHEDFERVLKNKFLQTIMMNYILKTMQLADHVFTVSHDTIKTLRSYGYLNFVDVVRNGTDLIPPKESEQLIATINEKYALENEKNVFLSVGRIVSNKKIDLAIKALKIVKEKGHSFKFLIVGAGSYESELKELTKNLGLENEIVFTGKVMDRQKLSGLYLRSDLFFLPSTFDTASLAPLEAAALSLPTLMNKDCSTAEIITDMHNGYLANESPEDWADKIIVAISNKEELKEIGKAAYAEVYRSWDSVTDEILDKYKTIIEGHQKQPQPIEAT